MSARFATIALITSYVDSAPFGRSHTYSPGQTFGESMGSSRLDEVCTFRPHPFLDGSWPVTPRTRFKLWRALSHVSGMLGLMYQDPQDDPDALEDWPRL